MEQRKLGGLKVSAMGLGCMSMSQGYGSAERKESERTLHRALDIGYTFLDTASVYGTGHNESLLGETLRNRRDEFFLAVNAESSTKMVNGALRYSKKYLANVR